MSSISESESPGRSGPYPDPFRTALAATDLSQAADAALASAGNHRGRVIVTPGRPAEQRGADLVALGTHGYNPLSRRLVGSVATAIAGSIDRPSLVVPPKPAREDDEPS